MTVFTLAIGSWALELRRRGDPPRSGLGPPRAIEAPIAGVVDQLLVHVGDQVQPGQAVCVIEGAEVEAKIGGRVVRVLVAPGHRVQYGSPVLELVGKEAGNG